MRSRLRGRKDERAAASMNAARGASGLDRALRALLPIVMLALACWPGTAWCERNDIPPYVLPGRGLVFDTLVSDWAMLSVVAAGDARRPRWRASRSR